MQERYLGDVHDFYKFLFIKFLSLRLKQKIGLNWYLTDPYKISYNEVKLNDGEKRSFLKDSYNKILDNELFNEMNWLKEQKNRKLNNFQKNSHLKNNIVFFSKEINIESRESWFDDSLNYFKNYDFIFLDPDNGLIPESFKTSKKNSLKYLLISEIKELIKQKKTIFFCQFQSFSIKHKLMLEKKKEMIEKIGLSINLPIIRNRVSPNTFFITIAQKNHEVVLEKIFNRYVTQQKKTELIYL